MNLASAPEILRVSCSPWGRESRGFGPLRADRAGRFFVALILSSLITPASLAQHEDKPGETVDQFRHLEELGRAVEGFDWNKEVEYIHRSIENMWAQQNWTDEADFFAREVVKGTAAIPPWKPLERIDYLIDRYADRYEVSPELKRRMRLLVIRESSGLLVRHADKLMNQAREYLELRAAGEPFTPELVARWVRDAKPIFEDINRSVDKLANEIRPAIPPSSLLVFDRDRLTYAKRRNDMEIAMERWIGGQWTPAEWGLQNDPIHSGGQGNEGGKQPLRSNLFQTLLPTTATQVCTGHNPDTWPVCVLEFARQYDLDPAQRTSAHSILSELIAWAKDHQRSHREQLEAVPKEQRATSEAYEPIRKAFMELQLRLDALPTSAQRERIHSFHVAAEREFRERSMNEEAPPE
jgi:hypothetical protein